MFWDSVSAVVLLRRRSWFGGMMLGTAVLVEMTVGGISSSTNESSNFCCTISSFGIYALLSVKFADGESDIH